MWIFTSRGFLSAVQHRDDPGKILLRARMREHLQTIVDDIAPLATSEQIEETPDADYRWRIVIKRDYFGAILVSQLDAINYGNFKNSIPMSERRYHNACHDVWGVMNELQQPEQPLYTGRYNAPLQTQKDGTRT